MSLFTLETEGNHEGMANTGNWYLNQTVPKIPLGIDRETGELVWMRAPIINGRHISDTVLVCGGTGSGKSVTAKNIICHMSIVRPIMVFDWAGQDSYLMKYPNSQPYNLAANIRPFGIKGTYLYYPTKDARPRMPYERIVMPNLCKYNQDQLEALGFSPGAAKYFMNILKRYGPFKNLNTLYDFIEKFPVRENDSRYVLNALKSGKMHIKHHKKYKLGDTINGQSKESIKKILPRIIDSGVFRLDNRYEFPFEKSFISGENLIFSFNSKEVGRVEINYYMKRIEIIRKNVWNSPKYFVMIEEAHKVLMKSGEKVSEVIDDFILVCRKLGIGLILIMPTVLDIAGQVLNDFKRIISSRFKGENASILIRSIADSRARCIPYLKFNRFAGAQGSREMFYYDSDYGMARRFFPFNSPCEIHRE
jgi:hypothetical protein